MKIFEKVKIKLAYGKSRIIKMFGLPVFKYDIVDNRWKKRKLLLLHKEKYRTNKPIVYLKVNSLRNYSILCLQNWIKVIEELDYDYIIICDNIKLENLIYKEIVFQNSNIKIMKSLRNTYLKNIANKIANKTWINAALAHLTTFYHAKKFGIKAFWNIDADDTTFLVPNRKLVKILQQIETYTDANDIKCISLDMWRSWTKGAHWSFGINFVDNTYNWFNVIEQNSKGWLDILYSKYSPSLYNIDWYFSYLGEFKQIPIKTFYIENCKFIHWDDFPCRKNYACLCQWKEGVLYYPVLNSLFNDKQGKVPIAQDCIKFEFGLNEEEANEFYNKLIPTNKVSVQ